MAGASVLMDSAGFLALWDASDSFHRSAVQLQGELIRKHRYYVLESLCLRIIIFAIQLPWHATAVYQPPTRARRIRFGVRSWRVLVIFGRRSEIPFLIIRGAL
jgi:hypothetical protein